MIKLFPNEITTNNSLVNNPSINRFNELITVKVSASKEDSYEFDPQKITFKNFMEIRSKPLKRCGTASENISSRKDNDSTKFNKTINGNIPPEAKINSKLKMLMNSHEFASIFDQIKMPNDETFGIDLRDPLNYSRSKTSGGPKKGFDKKKENGEKTQTEISKEIYSPSQSRTDSVEKAEKMKIFNSIKNKISPKKKPVEVSFNFIHINIMSSNDSQTTVENQKIGMVTPDNTMVKTNQLRSNFLKNKQKLSLIHI